MLWLLGQGTRIGDDGFRSVGSQCLEEEAGDDQHNLGVVARALSLDP